MRWLIGCAGLVAAVILAEALWRPGSDLATQDDAARLGYLGILLLTLLSTVGAAYWRRPGAAVMHLAIWLAIFTGLVAGWSYRRDLAGVGYRALSVVVPGLAVPEPDGRSIAVAKSGDGHFHIRASIAGRPVQLIVDTGASTVTLRAEDAARLDLHPRDTDYTVPTSTANGRASAAPVILPDLTIGDVTLRQVRALVARPGALDVSLLGNSYLERLDSFTVSGDRLILRP